MPKKPRLDWDRVTQILRANSLEDVIRCPSCAANGAVMYIAEHVLTAHAASPAARQIQRLVLRGAAKPDPVQ